MMILSIISTLGGGTATLNIVMFNGEPVLFNGEPVVYTT